MDYGAELFGRLYRVADRRARVIVVILVYTPVKKRVRPRVRT